MDTAIGGLRKRLKNGRSLDENVVVDHAADIIADIDDKANNKGITTDSSSTTATNVINATRTTYSNRRWLLYVYYLLHIMATTCFIFGFVFTRTVGSTKYPSVSTRCPPTTASAPS